MNLKVIDKKAEAAHSGSQPQVERQRFQSDPNLQEVETVSGQYIVAWLFLMLGYTACMAGLGHLLEWW